MHGAAMTNIRRTGIKATKHGKPNPAYAAAVHDRRSTDIQAAHAVPMEVEDPMGLDPGDKIVVSRNTRNDPLANLHSRRQIEEAQYQGGRAFQADWERAERGPQAIDPTKEAVDGGRIPEPFTEGQRKAVLRLNRCERELGSDGSALCHDVLIHGMTMAQVGQRRGLSGERWEKYFGTRFRECLDRLSVIYGFATAVHSRKVGA